MTEETIVIEITKNEILQAVKEDKAKQMLLPWIEQKLQEAGLELTEDAKSILVNLAFLTMKKVSQISKMEAEGLEERKLAYRGGKVKG